MTLRDFLICFLVFGPFFLGIPYMLWVLAGDTMKAIQNRERE
jgi:hypothetical protein